jgi:serine/threonine protein kinase
MLHEAHALSVAANPFVVQLLDHGVFVGQPFLVLELIGGCTLAQAIATDEPATLERAVSLFRKILDAVEALHARGVIHADLTPENIMLSPHHGDERIRLLDLGAARVNGTTAIQRDEVFGTPGYIPPEIATGAELEPSSDVYAAGVLLFELLTGVRPFSGTSLHEVSYQQLHARLPRPSRVRLFAPPRVCAAVDAVVATALSPSRAQRYGDVASLRLAFEQALDPDMPGTASDAVPVDASDAPTSRLTRHCAPVTS